MSCIGYKTIQVRGIDIMGLPVEQTATLYCCPDCKTDRFIVYQVDGHDHHHIECVKCKASFCFGGECPPLTNPENG